MLLNINGQPRPLPQGWHDETLLAVLREAYGLVGTKFGCGVGLCGACAVLVDGQPQRSCLLSAREVQGRSITTIEGLAAADDGSLHPVQQAWLTASVPQCGYCQAGQIVCAVALLRQHPQPSASQVDAAMAGQLCRCGTQLRIRRAIALVAAPSSS